MEHQMLLCAYVSVNGRCACIHDIISNDTSRNHCRQPTLLNEQNGGKKYRAYTTTSTKIMKKRRMKNKNYEDDGIEEEEEEEAYDVCLQHAVFSVHIDNNVLAVSRTLDQLKSNSTIAIFF